MKPRKKTWLQRLTKTQQKHIKIWYGRAGQRPALYKVVKDQRAAVCGGCVTCRAALTRLGVTL